MFYSTALALLVLAVVANDIFTSPSSEVAGDTMHTAAITAKR
jgi:hypothetical protein